MYLLKTWHVNNSKRESFEVESLHSKLFQAFSFVKV